MNMNITNKFAFQPPTTSLTEPPTTVSDSETLDEYDKNLHVDEDAESISDPLSEDVNSKTSEYTLALTELDSCIKTINWPSRASLFSNIPPYIQFNCHDCHVKLRFPNHNRHLIWKLSTITPTLLKKIVAYSGFTLVQSVYAKNQWDGTWAKHMISAKFKTLDYTQKINHFPGSTELGCKDKLWRNYQKMRLKFGNEYGFIPQSFILPADIKILKKNWTAKDESNGELWILKPPAFSKGVGVRIINKWSDLPENNMLVVQKYISNPYLINGTKFDLRLYVLVTSFNPLRIYLYPDGLVRFASAKYSDDEKDLGDKFGHLTNYSINKMSSQYKENDDASTCQGNKWTISKLIEYLQAKGADTKTLWKQIEEIVIKTMIACEPPIVELCEENMKNTYNCYELFGIDILLDDRFKPWLLEVNISPSLHNTSPVDAHVKGPLTKTMLDLAQFHFPPKLWQTVDLSLKCFDPRLYNISLSKKETGKHICFSMFESRHIYLSHILRKLTADDIRYLTRAEDELVVKGAFARIFPTAYTHKYLKFMVPRYYNRLFDAWEWKYATKREEGISLLQTLCDQKLHLQTSKKSMQFKYKK